MPALSVYLVALPCREHHSLVLVAFHAHPNANVKAIQENGDLLPHRAWLERYITTRLMLIYGSILPIITLDLVSITPKSSNKYGLTESPCLLHPVVRRWWNYLRVDLKGVKEAKYSLVIAGLVGIYYRLIFNSVLRKLAWVYDCKVIWEITSDMDIMEGRMLGDHSGRMHIDGVAGISVTRPNIGYVPSYL